MKAVVRFLSLQEPVLYDWTNTRNGWNWSVVRLHVITTTVMNAHEVVLFPIYLEKETWNIQLLLFMNAHKVDGEDILVGCRGLSSNHS